MKKILFCCFHPSKKQNYTPLDIGYIVALIKEKQAERYDIDILQLYYSENAKNGAEFTEYDASIIRYHRPRAVFFFLDNILWSGNYALHRAEQIIRKIRSVSPDIFVGVQSYKIKANETNELLKNRLADCVVKKDPEHSFLFLDRVLNRENVAGVAYLDDAAGKVRDCAERGIVENDLDKLPSPYLSGVFDNFLLKKQIDFGGTFRSYVYSSRGCPFGCYYCFRSVKYERVRFFSVERFYDEIEYLNENFGIKKFFIIDDAFATTPERMRKFADEFNERKRGNPALENISFDAMLRPETISPETISLLKQLNITWAQIGLQTVNPRLQKYITRKMPVSRFAEIARWLKKRMWAFTLT